VADETWYPGCYDDPAAQIRADGERERRHGYNSADLARAYTEGRDVERAAVVAALRHDGHCSPAWHADRFERGDHRG